MVKLYSIFYKLYIPPPLVHRLVTYQKDTVRPPSGRWTSRRFNEVSEGMVSKVTVRPPSGRCARRSVDKGGGGGTGHKDEAHPFLTSRWMLYVKLFMMSSYSASSPDFCSLFTFKKFKRGVTILFVIYFLHTPLCHWVNIPVSVGQIFRDLFRFIPVYSGYSGTFSKEIVLT